MKKNLILNIKYKQIMLFEPRTWWILRIGWQITKEYQDWMNSEKVFYKVAIKKGYKYVPDNLRMAMAESFNNNSKAFQYRTPQSNVVDIEDVIGQM